MAFNIHHILHLSSEVFYFFSIFIEPFEFNKHRIYLRQKLNIHHIPKNANQLLNFFAFFLHFFVLTFFDFPFKYLFFSAFSDHFILYNLLLFSQ